MGAVAHLQDDYVAARKFNEEGLAIHRELDDTFGIASSLNGLATVVLSEGDSATALPLVEESLTIFRQLGNESGICYCLLNLAEVAYINSDYEVAREYYVEVLTIAQNLGYKDRISFSLDGFALLATKQKEWKKAAQLTGAAEQLRETIGYELETHVRAFCNKYLEKVRVALGDSLFSTAYEQGRKMKMEEAVKLALSPIKDLKDLLKSQSFDEKLERSVSPDVHPTEVLHATTGDANLPTVQTSGNFSQQITKNKPLAAFAFIALLIGAVGLGFYFFRAKTSDWSADGKRTVAVLPLKPLNVENRDAGYELGIADSLIFKLSSAKNLVVRPLEATQQYVDAKKDAIAIGKEQQVDFVLASNYQIADGKIRITSQLINVSNGAIEEVFQDEQNISNIFAVQDAVAANISQKLLAKSKSEANNLAAKRYTTNEEAYRLYLQGTALADKRSRKDNDKAIEYFEQAVKLDPNYAPAYAGLANAQTAIVIVGGGNPSKQYPKAKAAIEKALAIDDNLAEAHSYAGEIKFVFEWDFAEAEAQHKRAIELSPNSSTAHRMYALLLGYLGRFDESTAEIKTAIDLEPASVLNHSIYGQILYWSRHYDESIAQFKRSVEMDADFPTNYNFLIRSYRSKGDDDQAFEWFVRARTQRGDKPDEIQLWKTIYAKSGWRGVNGRQLEKEKEREKTGDANAMLLAHLYIELEMREEAFAYLEKAFGERRWAMTTLKVEPRFDSLRSDPRFEELVKRVGLK